LHVEEAIARIDREGVPRRRESTKFHLVVEGRRYPPKYVISLAAAHATGRELRPYEFSGGDETNSVLQSLGFTVVGPGLPVQKPAAKQAPVVLPRPARVAASAPKVESTNGAATIVRVVVQGSPASSPRTASEMLLEAFSRWPTSGRAKFTITPGGFLVSDFPLRWGGGIAWDSSPDDLDELVRIAKPLVDECVTAKVLAAAKPLTHVLTIGVDLMSDVEHAELVVVIDCDSGKVVQWTGKSYPTARQENTLVQVADIDSHLLEIADEKVLVLGCHDLNMFSARARANQNPNGMRRQRCDEMARATAQFKPTVVLQHPHSTDTANIWRMPWACLARDYPSVRAYASGIGYFNRNGPVRQPIREVLAGTRSQFNVADVVVKSR
jgi:hypothetical protein